MVDPSPEVDGIPDHTGGPDAYPIDLGGGIRLREEGPGFRIRHRCKTGNGDRPTDFAIWNAPFIDITSGNFHRLVSREPLTIVASVLCPSCKLHGFITAGKWVPC